MKGQVNYAEAEKLKRNFVKLGLREDEAGDIVNAFVEEIEKAYVEGFQDGAESQVRQG